LKNKNIKVITILSYGRSGTGLMCSLLDGHSKISIFPDHIIQNFYNFWDFYHLKSKSYIFKKFTEIFEIVFDPKENKNYFHKSVGEIGSAYSCGFTQLGDKKNYSLKVNKNKFIKFLNSYFVKNKFNRKNFFIAIHFAYNFCLYKKNKTEYIVFNFHVPSRKSFKKFLEDFPDASFIQMVREPLIGMYSMFRAFNDKYFFNGNYLYSILNHMKSRGNYQFINRKRLIYIKLEDLHKSPKQIIAKLCRKFSLKYENILFLSTINKLKWHNETGSSPRISGFSEKFINQKFNKFYWKKDDLVFFYFLKDKYKLLGYRNTKYSLVMSKLLFYICILFPFKIEIMQLKKKFNIKNYKYLIKNFFRNRYLILKFLNKKKIFKIYNDEL